MKQKKANYVPSKSLANNHRPNSYPTDQCIDKWRHK